MRYLYSYMESKNVHNILIIKTQLTEMYTLFMVLDNHATVILDYGIKHKTKYLKNILCLQHQRL